MWHEASIWTQSAKSKPALQVHILFLLYDPVQVKCLIQYQHILSAQKWPLQGASRVDVRSDVRVRDSPLYGYPGTLHLKPRRGPAASVHLTLEAVGCSFCSLCDSEQWTSNLWSPACFMEPPCPYPINHCHFEFLQCFTKSAYADLSVGLKLVHWRSVPILSSWNGHCTAWNLPQHILIRDNQDSSYYISYHLS